MPKAHKNPMRRLSLSANEIILVHLLLKATEGKITFKDAKGIEILAKLTKRINARYTELGHFFKEKN